jgi:hypothetical protein
MTTIFRLQILVLTTVMLACAATSVTAQKPRRVLPSRSTEKEVEPAVTPYDRQQLAVDVDDANGPLVDVWAEGDDSRVYVRVQDTTDQTSIKIFNGEYVKNLRWYGFEMMVLRDRNGGEWAYKLTSTGAIPVRKTNSAPTWTF